jgi:mRNA-degrading endonuclease toxin of MazEF toxin-antitoxin module
MTSQDHGFDHWNELKKKINNEKNTPDKYPKEGEIWMCSIGKNIGYEQNGSGDNFSRPVMIITKFNNHMFWCVPLSTKQKDFDFYYNYTDVFDQKVSAIVAQLKLISVKRLTRKLYDIDNGQLEEIKVKLTSFLR